MKLAVSGKGGVGKTTLAALLCLAYAEQGYKVVAVDADPDANLGSALGFSRNALEDLVPVAQREALIAERTGTTPGKGGQIFLMNPRVDDLPERFSLHQQGIRLLVMGHVSQGGSGCACPQNTLLSHLIRHLVIDRDEVVIIDMEAGLEHLGRGTARGVDAFIVVVEPGRRSIQTAHAVAKLAGDLGIRQVFVVANKVRSEDEEGLREALGNLPLLGMLPYEAQAVTADLEGESVKAIPALRAKVEDIRQALENRRQNP